MRFSSVSDRHALLNVEGCTFEGIEEIMHVRVLRVMSCCERRVERLRSQKYCTAKIDGQLQERGESTVSSRSPVRH